MDDFEFEPESQDATEEINLPGEQQETQTQEPEATSTSTNESEEVKDNPAWNDILKPVPEAFHPHLKGHLSRMEKYAQEAQQKYAGYKRYEEAGIQSDVIDQALQLVQAFNTNPRGIYDYLNQAYNFANAAANQQQSQGQQREETLEVGGEELPDISKDPRFQQLQNQAQFAAQSVIEMQNQQIRAQASAQIDNELNALRNHAQFKHIPEDVVIRQALGMAAAEQARTGREVPANLEAAAKALWDSGAFRPRVARQMPPNLTSRASGTPSEGDPLEGIGSKSRQSRTALVAQMMQQLSNDG